MVGWMRGLVNGLQNRLHPFESGTDLTHKQTHSNPSVQWTGGFLFQLAFVVP